jgi:hypothetical protein
MTKKEYSKLLTSSKWKNKRKIILKRDLNVCQICSVVKDIMHVHHKYYVVNKKPWEYPDTALVTLCEECHSEVHNTTKIPVHDIELNTITYKPAKKKAKNPIGNKKINAEKYRNKLKTIKNTERKEKFNSIFPPKEHTIGRTPARLTKKPTEINQ